jgi:hypothetical protein
MNQNRLYKKIAKRYGFKLWRKDRHGCIFERRYNLKTNRKVLELPPGFTWDNAWVSYICEQNFLDGGSTYHVWFAKTNEGGRHENTRLCYNLQELRSFLRKYFK